MTLTILLSTVLLAARLHRTSLAGAAATGAAHLVAESGAGARSEATGRIRAVLGPDAVVEWTTDGGSVTVTVAVGAPPVPGLPGTIRRAASARWEVAG